MSSQTLIPIIEGDLLLAAGIAYPSTVDSWRWLYRNRHDRGLDEAFRRVGRRILVDVPVYLECVRAGSTSPR
jgi:hypothetical protein